MRQLSPSIWVLATQPITCGHATLKQGVHTPRQPPEHQVEGTIPEVAFPNNGEYVAGFLNRPRSHCMHRAPGHSEQAFDFRRRRAIPMESKRYRLLHIDLTSNLLEQNVPLHASPVRGDG